MCTMKAVNLQRGDALVITVVKGKTKGTTVLRLIVNLTLCYVPMVSNIELFSVQLDIHFTSLLVLVCLS